MNNETKRNIILENYKNPKNRGFENIDTKEYIKSNTSNESCIDEINLMAKIKNNKIEDIRFEGEACAICISSTSIMIDTLINKTIEEANTIYDNFENMVNEKKYDEQILEKASIYNDIAKQPSRKKCALLPWWGIKKIINEYDNNSKLY